MSIFNRLWEAARGRASEAHTLQQPYSKHVINNYTTMWAGEYPPVPFMAIEDFYNATPQLDLAVKYTADLVMGPEINVNARDEKVQDICKQFIESTNLYHKTTNVLKMTLKYGTGIFVKEFNGTELEDVEEFDIPAISRVTRDKYGNIDEFIYHVDGGDERRMANDKTYAVLILDPNDRKPFGNPMFHTLLRQREGGAIIEGLWRAEKAIIDTIVTKAAPRTIYTYAGGLDKERQEVERKKLSQLQPGESLMYFDNNAPRIDTIKMNEGGRYDSYFAHLANLITYGAGFPYEIMNGDFTSRASSTTTNSFYLRSVARYQSILARTLLEEVFYVLLLNHPSGKWGTLEKCRETGLTIGFKSQNRVTLSPEQIVALTKSNVLTQGEARQWCKDNGLNLFEDDEAKKLPADQDQLAPGQSAPKPPPRPQ